MKNQEAILTTDLTKKDKLILSVSRNFVQDCLRVECGSAGKKSVNFKLNVFFKTCTIFQSLAREMGEGRGGAEIICWKYSNFAIQDYQVWMDVCDCRICKYFADLDRPNQKRHSSTWILIWAILTYILLWRVCCVFIKT